MSLMPKYCGCIPGHCAQEMRLPMASGTVCVKELSEASKGGGDAVTCSLLLDCEPTPEQIFNACMYFRHDYGLLNDADAGVVEWNALEWLKAWKKALGAI